LNAQTAAASELDFNPVCAQRLASRGCAVLRRLCARLVYGHRQKSRFPSGHSLPGELAAPQLPPLREDLVCVHIEPERHYRDRCTRLD
jgi:hypothetical protein